MTPLSAFETLAVFLVVLFPIFFSPFETLMHFTNSMWSTTGVRLNFLPNIDPVVHKLFKADRFYRLHLHPEFKMHANWFPFFSLVFSNLSSVGCSFRMANNWKDGFKLVRHVSIVCQPAWFASLFSLIRVVAHFMIISIDGRTFNSFFSCYCTHWKSYQSFLE